MAGLWAVGGETGVAVGFLLLFVVAGCRWLAILRWGDDLPRRVEYLYWAFAIPIFLGLTFVLGESLERHWASS